MEIDFADDKLKLLCEKEKIAKRELGNPSAKKLKTRLADIQAALSVADLAAGKPHPLEGDRAGEFSLQLEGGRCLTFISNNTPVP